MATKGITAKNSRELRVTYIRCIFQASKWTSWLLLIFLPHERFFWIFLDFSGHPRQRMDWYSTSWLLHRVRRRIWVWTSREDGSKHIFWKQAFHQREHIIGQNARTLSHPILSRVARWRRYVQPRVFLQVYCMYSRNFPRIKGTEEQQLDNLPRRASFVSPIIFNHFIRLFSTPPSSLNGHNKSPHCQRDKVFPRISYSPYQRLNLTRAYDHIFFTNRT